MPPKGKFAQLTSWSYSVYQQYCKCPLSICFDKIQRIRITEPDNPAFIKGNRAHDMADKAITALGKKAPVLIDTLPSPVPKAPPIKIDLTPVKADLMRLRVAKARTEQEWAFTRTWEPCDWRDWDRAWLRIKTDVCADTTTPPTVEIIDWKTGKQHPEHTQQRSLYGLGGLQLVQIGGLAGGSKETVLTAKHVYLDTGVTATETFQMKQLPALKREWLARVKHMFEDTTYPAKTGMHCRWCKFRKSAGGPCKENQ